VEANRLSLLSRGKILDNLRRSTIEIAQLAFLVIGWTLLPVPVLRWTLFGLGAIAAPWIVSILLAMLRPPLDKSWRAYYAAVGRDCADQRPAAGAGADLPPASGVDLRGCDPAHGVAAAACRGVTCSSGRPPRRSERGISRIRFASCGSTCGRPWRWPPSCWRGRLARDRGPAGHGLAVAARRRGVAAGARAGSLRRPVAYALGAPAVPQKQRLAAGGRDASRCATRCSTGASSIAFVGDETSWLAPDNFQQDPEPVVAMRTSPTNIGLQLLSTVSAWDLGFLAPPDLPTVWSRRSSRSSGCAAGAATSTTGMTSAI
jgi:cyclic beta-1,2-glucan synthetase